MSAVNPCDPLDERAAAGFTLDEEQMIRDIRAALEYSRHGVPAEAIAAGEAVRATAHEDIHSFGITSGFAAALLVDDILFAHPELKPEAVLKEAAHILVTTAMTLVRIAKQVDGGEFEPGRLALATYGSAQAAKRAPIDAQTLAIFTFQQPGSLRAQFVEAQRAEDEARMSPQ